MVRASERRSRSWERQRLCRSGEGQRQSRSSEGQRQSRSSEGQRQSRSGDSRRRERGFTLLEIAVTLLIASILLAIAVPRLPSFGRTDLETSADRLAATMTYLADEASLRGRIYRLTLDLETETWDVAALAPFADSGVEANRPEFREDPDDPMARSIALPPGVFFDAVLDRDGETSVGTRAVYFLPEGLTENVGVRLGEHDGARTVVQLDAARGSARREETLETPE